MGKYLYVACDGGLQNTLAGSGGILEVRLDSGKFEPDYHEFADASGGSPHFVKASPNKKHLVMSCANTAQIYVFPRKEGGGGFDIRKPRIINNFCTLSMPDKDGPDATTDFFDFWGEGENEEDSDHIVTHFNKKLVKVNLVTEEIRILHDFSHFGPKNWKSGLEPKPRPEIPKFLHQITTKGQFIVVDDALGRCIYVFGKRGRDSVELLFQAGDGYCSGHHAVYVDRHGRMQVARPSFNFNTFGAAFKIQDNVLSIYSIEDEYRVRNVKTWHYAHFMGNHAPVDSLVEHDPASGKTYFYCAYGVPGSVMKIDVDTGAIAGKKDFPLPFFLKRFYYLLADFRSWHLSHGTMLKGWDRNFLDPHLHYLYFSIGTNAGTRGGIFTLAEDSEPGSDTLYACHRGFNQLIVMDKKTLDIRKIIELPRRKQGVHRQELFHNWLYRRSRYLSRGLGLHHGKVVDFRN